MKPGNLTRIVRFPRMLEALALAAAVVLLDTPAAAQFGGTPSSRSRPAQTAPQQPFNPFGGLFQQLWPQPAAPGSKRSAKAPSRAQLGDFSKAPPPRTANASAKTRVLVIGDSMADWLGHGLEGAYADDPEFGVVRRVRANTGLIPHRSRGSYDWIAAAPELMAKERPDFVIVLLGLSDRVSFPEAVHEQPHAETSNVDNVGARAQPLPAKVANHAFRSERWSALYGKRIDAMIAALKTKGVPVLWAGLPPIRGQRSRNDLAFLNDLYRVRAEKAGIAYVDLWNGFIVEDDKFSLRGPDLNGQIRQLRSMDGIYFTKAGAAKLSYFVEREIQRMVAARAMPVAHATPEPQPSGIAAPDAAPRRAAGPVIPLTDLDASTEELAGGGLAAKGSSSPLGRRVLLRGQALPSVPGRADDFSWPRKRSDPLAIIAVPAAQDGKPRPRNTQRGQSSE